MLKNLIFSSFVFSALVFNVQAGVASSGISAVKGIYALKEWFEKHDGSTGAKLKNFEVSKWREEELLTFKPSGGIDRYHFVVPFKHRVHPDDVSATSDIRNTITDADLHGWSLDTLLESLKRKIASAETTGKTWGDKWHFKIVKTTRYPEVIGKNCPAPIGRIPYAVCGQDFFISIGPNQNWPDTYGFTSKDTSDRESYNAHWCKEKRKANLC
ncbi:unnamed protein product [Cunninghamella echinulata]